MEEEKRYLVEITPEAEAYYLNLSQHLLQNHSLASASRKIDEILVMALSLEYLPSRGREVDELTFLGTGHKYLLYQITKRKAVRIIYFIDEEQAIVYVTDFFPTEMDPESISGRNS